MQMFNPPHPGEIIREDCLKPLDLPVTEAARGLYKLTMRELNRAAPQETVFPLTGPDIRELRERARLSQAVFAKYLNLTVDHVSKLERGTKHPTGPALVLLNVIRRKGIEAIL